MAAKAQRWVPFGPVGRPFPSMKAPALLAVLKAQPLGYEVKRQNGSHRRLVSANGYPPLTFSFHDNVTIPPRTVKAILTDDVGLTDEQAIGLL